MGANEVDGPKLLTRLRSWWIESQEAALSLVLPPVCRICDAAVAPGRDFCRRCEQSIKGFEAEMAHACHRCGRPRCVNGAAVTDEVADELRPCRACAKETYEFDEVVPLWPYRDRACEIVVASKYQTKISLAHALGARLGQRLVTREVMFPPDIVTFVPSYWTREITRGGVSTRVISEAVSREIRTKCRTLLAATRRIGKQAWLNDSARVANVRDAFRVKRLTRRKDLVNTHVIVVDDVLTTGATANEIARVLKSRGVRRVTLAVVARTVRGS